MKVDEKRHRLCFEAATTAKEVTTIPGDDAKDDGGDDVGDDVGDDELLHLCHDVKDDGKDDGGDDVGDDDYDDRGDVVEGAPTFHDSQHCNGDLSSPQPLLLGPGQKKHMKNHRMKEKMKINQKSWNEGEGENQTTILQNTPQCSNLDSAGCKPSSSCSPFFDKIRFHAKINNIREPVKNVLADFAR